MICPCRLVLDKFQVEVFELLAHWKQQLFFSSYFVNIFFIELAFYQPAQTTQQHIDIFIFGSTTKERWVVIFFCCLNFQFDNTKKSHKIWDSREYSILPLTSVFWNFISISLTVVDSKNSQKTQLLLISCWHERFSIHSFYVFNEMKLYVSCYRSYMQ